MSEARHAGPRAMEAIPRGNYTPDADLLILVDRWRRVGWLFVSIIVAIVLAAVVVGGLVIADNRSLISRQQGKLNSAQRRIDASCSWWHDVGSGDFLGPVPEKADRALVVIVADSRIAFAGQACPGRLPPESPKLAKWASYFQLKIAS